MFWLWAAVIVEGIFIFGLVSRITLLDRAAHQRLVYLEGKVESLLTDMKGKVDKQY